MLIALHANRLPDQSYQDNKGVYTTIAYKFCLSRYSAGFSCYQEDAAQRVCITGAGAGVDSAWEQKKLKARKMLDAKRAAPYPSVPAVRPALRNSDGASALFGAVCDSFTWV